MSQGAPAIWRSVQVSPELKYYYFMMLDFVYFYLCSFVSIIVLGCLSFSFSFSICEELQVGRGAPAIWRRSGHSYNGAAAWSFCSLGSWQSWVLPGLPISWFFLFLFLLHNIMTLYCQKLPRFWNSKAFADSVHWFVIWRSVTLSLHMRPTVLANIITPRRMLKICF